MTFTLPGFRTVRREGISLSASFTATVNVELQVGQLEESITVTGESPLVDVRSSVSQSVMNRETLDTIPTGKDPFAVGQLIAGVTTSTPDVGGTQIMQQPTLQVHGSSNNDNVFMVDNVQIQHIGFGGNQTGFYFNDGLMEEISYQTSSLPAEAPVGGVQINMIPRDGGNQYPRHGLRHRRQREHAERQPRTTSSSRSASSRAEPGEERLRRQRHLRRADQARPPVVLQHLPRAGRRTTILGNTFDADGEQAVDDQRITDATLRLTWQATPAAQDLAALRSQRQVARPPAEQLDHRQHQRADLLGRADDGPQLHRRAEVELADLEPAAGRGRRSSRCR